MAAKKPVSVTPTDPDQPAAKAAAKKSSARKTAAKKLPAKKAARKKPAGKRAAGGRRKRDELPLAVTSVGHYAVVTQRNSPKLTTTELAALDVLLRLLEDMCIVSVCERPGG